MTEVSSLASLLTRLEAATSKLEDLAMAGMSSASVSSSLTGATGVSGTLSTQASASGNTADQNPNQTHPSLEGYDELISGPLKEYLELSKAVGGPVAEQADHVNALFAAQREMIAIATTSQKPPLTSDIFSKLLEPSQVEMGKIIETREQNRSSPLASHLTTVAEGITALGWVTIEPKPAQYVGEMKDIAQFYANRVLKDWKEKDENHVKWVRSFIALLTELQNYVKKVHTTGLVWNPKGQDPSVAINNRNSSQTATSETAAAHAKATPPAPPAPSAGGPPPPPPPPPPMTDDQIKSKQGGKKDVDMTAVFAQLNQGEAITKNLRKVDKSQMTHKNPELRASGMVTAGAGKPGSPKRAGPGAPPKPASLTLKKPPKLALEGNKWVVENFENDHNVVLENVAINHTVYIYGCKNSTIQIKGKVNTISIDSCTKTGVCMDSLISSLDMVNSKSLQVQVLGKTPTIALDKIDSCLVYLSKECMDVEVLTSKCSSINILTPDSKEIEGDFVERPVPEQFLTKFVDGKMVTTAVEHSG
ncbi:hypothetical protein BGW42_004571 [Actinomortierella wolfii]|nr:hypothetical protein BGW42_004571 [Actinomortierella wolfii]